VIPWQDLVAEAIAHRPEIEQNQIALENSRLDLLGTKNNLLPTLSVSATLANNGQAGSVNSAGPGADIERQPADYRVPAAGRQRPQFVPAGRLRNRAQPGLRSQVPELQHCVHIDGPHPAIVPPRPTRSPPSSATGNRRFRTASFTTASSWL